MSVKTSELLEQAAIALQDSYDHTRWPLPELLMYLNSGLRELIWIAPLAYRAWRIVTLSPGPQQTISDAYQVLALTGNIKSGDYTNGVVRGRAVRQASLDRLQFYDPDWHAETGEVIAKEYALDVADRQSFWVYPPNDGTGQVECKLIENPAFVTEPANPDTMASYGTLDVNVDTAYAPALVYYIISRAWAKDADYAGNIEASSRYYQLFKTVIASNEPAQDAT